MEQVFVPGIRRKTILVVDDEARILKMVSGFLIRNDVYNVLTATSGAEAVQLSHEHQGEIDLLLTDFRMPEMPGDVLATEMSYARPNLKVLMMSGFTDGMLVLNEGWHFLSKPFIPSQLNAIIVGLISPELAAHPRSVPGVPATVIPPAVKQCPARHDPAHGPYTYPFHRLVRCVKTVLALRFPPRGGFPAGRIPKTKYYRKKGTIMQQYIALDQTVESRDLAAALEGNHGTFIARQGAQVFRVVSEQGHSIKSGPTPLGPPIAGVVSTGESPWYITKLSNSTESSYRERDRDRELSERERR